MRILLYVNSYLPVVGGREMVVHQLALAFQRLGHAVQVVGPGGWWRHRAVRFPYVLRRWPRLPLLPRETAWRLQLAAQRWLFAFDVIHAHSTYPCGYTAAKLTGRLGCPLVITPHGEDIHVVPEIGFGQRLDPVQDRKIRFALARADYVTAISDAVAASIRSAGVAEERIARIPNGVDGARFERHSTLDVHRWLGVPEDARLVVSVGNYHPRKGHEVLIEAIGRALSGRPELCLVIVGRTSEALVARVREQGLDRAVKFTGPLPPAGGAAVDDVLAALLQAADFYVSASVSEGAEGLSLAILEALSAGACVIATDVSGTRDVIASGVNGWLVPPGDAGAIAQALLDLCGDPVRRVALRERGRASAGAYSWSAIAQQYLALYARALDERNPGSASTRDGDGPAGMRVIR